MSGLDRIASRRGAEPNRARIEPPTPYSPPPVEVLPRPIRRLVQDMSNSLNCDPAMVMIPALCTCAAAIGASRSITPKRKWPEPCILWGVIISESGTKKSPAYDAAVGPLIRLQEDRYQDWREQMSRWKDGGRQGDPPIQQQVYTDDTTIEALAGVLRDNSHGVLMGQDELTSWFESMKQTRDRASGAGKWLSLHSGKTICINRKTGDERYVWVPSPRVSITGGIQPGIFHQTMGQRERDNGLLARLLLAWPPRRLDFWSDVEPDDYAIGGYERLVAALLSLKGETTDRDTQRPYMLRLTPDALAAYIHWYDRYSEVQFAATGSLASHLQKLRGGQCLRLAMIFHCADYADADASDRCDVSVASIHRATILADWFIAETLRIYRYLNSSEEVAEQMDLYSYIVTHFGGCCSASELHRRNKSRWPTTQSAEAQLEGLHQSGLGTWSTEQTGGRPKRVLNLAKRLPEDKPDECPSTPDGKSERPDIWPH